MKYLMIVSGAILFFLGLWCGAYFLHEFGLNDWKSFPIYMTSCISALGGMVLVAFGVFK